jgi:iron complex outermembrane receptor protein
MLNATIAYRMDLGNERSVELFARGSNLFDELAFNHASFIKNASPLRGRNVVFGLRTSF